MSGLHPNVSIIERFFKAYVDNDLESIKAILAPDIRWVIPGVHPLSGTKVGIEQVLDYLAKLSKAHFKAEPLVIGANDQYVIDCHRNWSNLENQANLDNMSCLLWKIENQKIAEVYNFPEDQYRVDKFFNEVFNSNA